MALATKCPHCNTIFRVAADQLKLRGGIVRCGSCHEVFDGNAALVEPAAKPTPVIPEVPVEPAHAPVTPAAGEYVHGGPVDFELDFAEEVTPAAKAAASEPASALEPEHAAPAVWRTASATPEDVAKAAVARAFAAATEHASPAPELDTKPLPWEDEQPADALPGDAPAPADDAAVLSADASAPADSASAVLGDASELNGAPAAAPGDAFALADDAAAMPGDASTSADDAAALDDDASGLASAPAAVPGDADAMPDDVSALADDAASGLSGDHAAQPGESVEQSNDAADVASDFIPAFLRAAPAKPEADAAGRIEPTFDAPQLEDLPSDEQPEPGQEQERDETALHAVAAVNTDVPDDGESLPDDEADEAPAATRRERALKRAQARSEAAGEEDEATTARAAAEARMRALAGVDEAASEDLDHSDLSFVKRHDRSQKYGKAINIAMAVGIPLLLAGLVLQAATTFRDALAASYPQLKPALNAVCAPLGCKVALPTQLDALSIEQGELASMAENTFSFTTVLRNQSKTVQAWPHIELTLNDNADKPVLRRVFTPREYLPSASEAEKGFGPRSEQSIKLYFELKELKASGYHIAIFYP
ncbi:DUF3426 domain-containing protein [Pseudoduganella sp. OTU4001]|uniref:DUF3426 domain-containing protein n=1 Tax=Pseudoduganella sp. OTU4001 TaxID=3043854 RepID=UPI00313E7CA9